MVRAYLEPSEIEKLIAAARYQRDGIFIRTLYRAGCRVSEVIALEEKNVDFTQGTITIQHLKCRISLATRTLTIWHRQQLQEFRGLVIFLLTLLCYSGDGFRTGSLRGAMS